VQLSDTHLSVKGHWVGLIVNLPWFWHLWG